MLASRSLCRNKIAFPVHSHALLCGQPATALYSLAKPSSPRWYASSSEETPATAGGLPLRKITREQVSRHNSGQDCWIIINRRVYNVSSWVDVHPGGREILWEHAGKDATDRWLSAGHTARARALMEKYIIGYVEEKKRYSGYAEALVGEMDDSNYDVAHFREEEDVDEKHSRKYRSGLAA